MDQQLLREQCEAYVLGALDGEERLEVERLIDSRDPGCLAALEEARELVAQVALMAPVLEPPAPLRAKVLSAIAAEPRNVVSIATRRRPNYLAWAAMAAAAGLAVVAIVARNNAGRWESEFARVHDEYVRSQSQVRALSADAERYQQVIAVLAARDARMIRLATSAPQEPQFRAYWSRPAGLVLLGENVTAPPGRTLQLWVVTKKGEAVSAGVFQPNEQGQVVMIAQASTPPEEAAALAISDEPAGGSPQPTTKPTWTGPVAD
jgi:anti-sigma-K factor RskA